MSGHRTYLGAGVSITDKALARFERASAWLLKVEGQGYRLRSGKSSVYLLPGQLEYTT